MKCPLSIEYLHKIRAEHWEEIKHLTPEERLKLANENGRRLHEKAMAMKKAKVCTTTQMD